MSRNRIAALIVASLVTVSAACAFAVGVAREQENGPTQPPPAGEATRKEKESSVLTIAKERIIEAAISKMIAEFDLEPHPLPPIPDDPPPHEGALISRPYVVEPSDMMIVELLEALPGRPISGERLVRSDGTISLGFYGEIHVKGLTLDQIKVAVIKQLRQYLTDQALGLMVPVSVEPSVRTPAIPEIPKPAIPELPKNDESPLDGKESVKPRSSSNRSSSASRLVKPRAASHRPAGRAFSVRRVTSQADSKQVQEKAEPATAPNQLTVPIGGSGRVTITIQVESQGPLVTQPALVVPPDAAEQEELWKLVSPEKSQTVYVDVTAYNTKNYYVTGDVAVTGRIAWTGHETILDAIQFVGGFLPTAEPKDIRLIRPERTGVPARIYKVDFAAIQEKGDVVSNYQIFPGDRLIVGRNEIVQKTVEIDRLAAPIQTTTGSIRQFASMLRDLQAVDPANSDALLKELVDFWTRELWRKGDLKFDEETLRKALLQRMNPTPMPKK